MRCYFIVMSLLSTSGWCQTVNKSNSIAGPEFSHLKYSIAFADQSQVAYDGSDLSKSGFIKFMPPSIAEAADIDYYVGHYGASAGGYYSVVSSLPRIESNKGAFSLYKLSMNLIDYKNLSDDEAKLYTAVVNAAGMLYHTRGKFVYADSMLTRSMKVRAVRFGRTSREYINSLSNAAVLKRDIGDYDEAEKMLNYLSKTVPKLYGANSVQNVIIINNRAMLFAELGRTKEALQLLDEALSIGKDVLSDSYMDYERILTNRALIEQESGSIGKAAEYYKQVLSNMERKGFDDHPDYNNVLVYYGALRIIQDDNTVLEFLETSQAKVKKRYGELHPLMARATTNLGEFHLRNNSYAEAKIFFQLAADIQLKVLGDKHKDYLASLVKVAICQWLLNETLQSSINFKKAMNGYLFLLDSFFPTMSESEKTKFWGTLKPNVGTFMAFAVSIGDSNPGILVDAYNLHLKTKGILFSSTNQTKEAILGSGDSVANQKYSEWLQLKNTLANYYSSPLEDIEEDKVDLAALEAQANVLEKDLSQRSAIFQSGYSGNEASFETIQNSLKENEGAIEVIRVNHMYGPQKNTTQYAGLIVTKKSVTPTLVKITDGATLEKRSLAFYKNSIQAKIDETNSYKAYWSPFQSSLETLDKVYVSLDGVYNSINLNTLKRDTGKYLIDEENIVLLPSTRFIKQLDNTGAELIQSDGIAALVGSPDFGQQGVIDPLPGTKLEIEKIDALLKDQQVKTEVLMEESATEHNLKLITTPSVLHIATHGYFLSDVSSGDGMAMGVSISRAKENPLLRSGLLFTGAESSLLQEQSISGGDNGILNAYEVMNLNLRDTRLVIMSACETGQGEVVNGEGVYGLSRSFQIAGAKKIIMSLWKVDDSATQELMTSFYNHWIKTDNPQEAFLMAQREVKSKYAEPYYWGAFVLLN